MESRAQTLPPQARLPLSMRPCVIAVEAKLDDYSVVCDGVTVGRIMRGHMPADGDDWSWRITCLLRPARADHSGRTNSLEAAKRDWAAKWAEVNPDIEHERRAHAEFVERMARFGKPGRAYSRMTARNSTAASQRSITNP
jgi:hypothetical protein